MQRVRERRRSFGCYVLWLAAGWCVGCVFLLNVGNSGSCLGVEKIGDIVGLGLESAAAAQTKSGNNFTFSLPTRRRDVQSKNYECRER